MSKTLVIALLFAMAAAGASAAGLGGADRIILVQGGQHAADVVTGANFAAAMRSAQGVTYASAIDTDAYAQLSDSDLQGKTVVVIDGKDVKILGSDPAAQSYFAQQGFNVRTVSSPTRADLLVSPPADQAQQPDQDAAAQSSSQASQNGRGADTADVTDDTAGAAGGSDVRPRERDTTFVANETAQAPPAEQQNSGQNGEQSSAAPEAPAQTPRADQPGVLTRVWRWFAGLF
jgi:hypothetical protein